MANPDPAIAEWPLIKKLLFCFFFIFFILYIFLNPNEIVPYSYYLHKLYLQPCTGFISWLAKDVLHIVGPPIKFYNGTIDTAFGYITVLFIFFIAILGSFIWVAVDKTRLNYHKLYKILIIVLRYYLAITLIAYGSLKIIQLQFPSLSPLLLLQTYGGSTPKDLAWSFMGYSTGYNYFIGFLEYTAGLLLFFRRTRILGSLVAFGILANVIAFNYSFDVNVKLLSTMLMVMTLFLLSKDIKRLACFFFLNKIVYPADDRSFRFKKKWKNRVLLVSKYAFIVCIIFFDLHGDLARAKQNGGGPIKPPLYGIYNVTAFIRNRDTIKPLTTDTTRWDKLVISSQQGNASVIFMNDSLKYFIFKPDTIKKEIVMYAEKDTSDKYTFAYDRPKDGFLIIRGKWHGDSLEIKLQKYDINRFPLMHSSFRWIIDRNFHNKK